MEALDVGGEDLARVQDVLRVEEIPIPTPGPGQVLVEVVATSVNLSDWEGLTGSPAYPAALPVLPRCIGDRGYQDVLPSICAMVAT